ncbi:possible Bacterial type II secretion system pr [Prochlorococcus marinus subsp. pastoris str. CCMP1986]|uniref:Possible Bacterial type II secretion system pr n=1 Tax=Prochlorococcus marinus subsp. pastoris (strain CCMP1986 / NIES-2087 / MED4) TaxID=59919 RepID=Q7TUH8_PROMP|nr:DUF6554 family protein [Prochlorococcus marinus]KGF88221.1 putative Bacterial type II secretion system pr [Prochlorococcus marinus str. EQPAC1]CAE18491.1 possible Bacterial type II secretion system pr [Prochlorococcus marinus subsp. pastoris str. CCMP1986]
MKGHKKIRFIFPLVAMYVPLLLLAPKAIAGSFGAEIFCTMRDGGNDHESSWQAAYSYIKKQKGGIFKTSPKQAAGQIIETVVRERDKFSYCVEFLDQLHPDRKLQLENDRKEKRRKKEELLQDKENEDYSKETFDRYSY